MEPRNASKFRKVTKFYYISINQTNKLKILMTEIYRFRNIEQPSQIHNMLTEIMVGILEVHTRTGSVTVNVILK